MTQDQVDKLKTLRHAANRVVSEAEDSYIHYKLAAAIARLDDAHGECWYFIDELEADEPSDSAGGSQ